MKDLINIIIPVYNSEKYIKKCLDSALSQSYKNIEIIVIENGSTDNSLKILKEYEKNITLIVLKEKGLSLARNKGIDVSKGKYISFLDSDDSIDNTYIEKLYNSLIDNASDMSCCNIKEIFQSTNKIIDESDFPNNNLEKEEILNNLEKFRFGPNSKLFKSSIIKDNNIKFPIMKYEDVYFVLSYLLKCNKVSKVNENLYNYFIHNNSEQTTVDSRIFDIFKVIDLIEKLDLDCTSNLIIQLLVTYSLKTRYIVDKKVRNDFINRAYYMLSLIDNWKNSRYVKSCNFIKQLIIKNKKLVKIYTFIYSIKFRFIK